MAVNAEREAGSLTSTSDHALIPGQRERGQALGNEDVHRARPSGVSRWSRRSARNSFPPSGCTLAMPPLARRTCSLPVVKSR